MKNTIQINSFMQVKGVGHVEISPSGAQTAFVVTRANDDLRGYTSHVAVYDHAASARRYYPQWLGEEVVFRTEDELLSLHACPPNAVEFGTEIWQGSAREGNARRLCTIPFKAVSILGMRDHDTMIVKGTDHAAVAERLSGLEGDERGREIARIEDERSRFSVFDEYPYYFNGKGIINGERTNIYAVNVETGAYKSLFPQGFYIENATYSREMGKVLACGFQPYRVRMYKEALFLASDDGGEWRELIPAERFRIERVALWQGRGVITVNMEIPGSGRHTSTRILWVDCATGATDPMSPQPFYVGNPVLSDVRLGAGRDFKADGDWLYCLQGDAEDCYLMRYSADGRREKVAGECGSVDAFDVRDGVVRCTAMQVRDGSLPELYEVENGSLRRLTDLNGWFLRNYNVQPLEPLTFTCDEGVDIHGFVLKPVGYEPGKRYPMILDIHGGPGMAYGQLFMHEMQYWAAQGYFVAFCNPRGSCSRGEKFANIFGKFGTMDYDDLMRFTDVVLEKYPDIDPKRMGVTGGSYGGYITNWIIGHTDRFAAAASQRSISNMMTMDGVSDCAGYLCEEWTFATAWTDIQQVWRLAPLAYAKNVRTPTLFLQSDEDFRCPPTEALQMFTAVLQTGTEARMVLFKGECHGLSRNGKPVNRTQRLKEITCWMDAHCK